MSVDELIKLKAKYCKHRFDSTMHCMECGLSAVEIDTIRSGGQPRRTYCVYCGEDTRLLQKVHEKMYKVCCSWCKDAHRGEGFKGWFLGLS